MSSPQALLVLFVIVPSLSPLRVYFAFMALWLRAVLVLAVPPLFNARHLSILVVPRGKVRVNDHASWDRLLRFSSRCFRVPARGGHRRSLATAINRQLSDEVDYPTTPSRSSLKKFYRPPQDPFKSLASRVSLKLEEGDFKGAVRLACSEDTIADMSEATFSALQQKHPSPHPDSSIPPLPQDFAHTVSVSLEEVANAIRSFPNGSAGGPDGLRPQHLKDMVGPSTDGGGHALLSALASFLTLVLAGRTPPSIRPFFSVPL